MNALPGRLLLLLLPLLLSARATAAPIPDEPFWQDVAVRIRHAPELTNAVFRKLCVDKENVVHVLTDKGVARVFDDTLALDRSYRPLAGKVPRDITLSPEGDLYYLLDDHWFTGGGNGRTDRNRIYVETFAVAGDGVVYAAGGGDSLQSSSIFGIPRRSHHFFPLFSLEPKRLCAVGDADFLTMRSNSIARIHWDMEEVLPSTRWHRSDLAVGALAVWGNRIWLGSTNRIVVLDAVSGATELTYECSPPVSNPTCLLPVHQGLWVGTARGAYFERDGTNSRYATPFASGIEPPRFRYYAGKRWLRDDHVVQLATDRDGHLWVLTQTGLNKIEFRQTTLAAKADWFHRKIRSRNMRYGFTAERRLLVPGDITSSEMIDTDNDGGWTSYYLGSLAARYAVTREEETRRQAWESFGALERLQSIHTNTGFPARTFERRGFKFSDIDRWRNAPDPGWEWKGHTSSDEMQAQGFAHAVMWELVATNATERARVATNWVAVMDHILRHNLYLVDVDGEPTLWGRWNPEYVNWFPHTIGDRRLNSAEIIAGLQLAYRMTGNEAYRAKAYELFEQHGYLMNILSSMKLIAPTKGYIFRGNDMGNEWNHSDDELCFFNYWTLVRFAFTDELRAKYLAAVADHWDFEQAERYPIFNFIFAACGGKEFDPAGAVWTLRGTPLDTVAWRMSNSHRQDITKLEPNFMGRELKELLPPGERFIARINTQPFILDYGDDTTDFPGDEYLLGYWLGRYVGAIVDAK